MNRPAPAACRGAGSGLLCLFASVALVGLGCKKDVARDASESDANGYLCLKCGAKLYTNRSVFIGPRCPKCQEDTLVEVVGYRCGQDPFVTIRPARGDSRGLKCEKCQASLANAMFLPRAKDLQTWGAAKTK
jgi:DNA-directed RNA polymerase subunit RPC12/RpoP